MTLNRRINSIRWRGRYFDVKGNQDRLLTKLISLIGQGVGITQRLIEHSYQGSRLRDNGEGSTGGARHADR